MDLRTKNRLLSAGRELTFTVCVGGGTLIGLLAGLHESGQTPPPPKCTTPIASCVSDGISHGIWTVLTPVFIGALIGMAIAAFLCLTILRPQRAGPTRSPVGASAASRFSDGKWIRARYPGRCKRCNASVVAGDKVFHSSSARAVWCASCAPA